jgi:hypothetical protein
MRARHLEPAQVLQGVDGGTASEAAKRPQREGVQEVTSRGKVKGVPMPPNEPTPAQIDLIRQLVRSVTLENAHAEYEKARRHFTTTEGFQAALRAVELEIQQHLMLIEHWNHLAAT